MVVVVVVSVCTDSFRQQYVHMLQVMATSQYRDHLLSEIQQQLVGLVYLTVFSAIMNAIVLSTHIVLLISLC